MIWEIKAVRVKDGESIPVTALLEASSKADAIYRLGEIHGGHNFSIISVARSECANAGEYILIG